MKIIKILLLSVISFSTYAQVQIDTLTCSNGMKITKGQMLKLGTGSRPDGDFKFVRVNSGSLFRYGGDDAFRSAKNSANSIGAGASGLQYKVVRIEKRGSKKAGYVYYPIINIGMVRYEVDIENAIKVGEIVVPDEFKEKATLVAQPTSLSDELKKLKDLYDGGALTKEEYDAAKKKILSQ